MKIWDSVYVYLLHFKGYLTRWGSMQRHGAQTLTVLHAPSVNPLCNEVPIAVALFHLTPYDGIFGWRQLSTVIRYKLAKIQFILHKLKMFTNYGSGIIKVQTAPYFHFYTNICWWVIKFTKYFSLVEPILKTTFTSSLQLACSTMKLVFEAEHQAK